MTETLLEIDSVSKAFPGVRALVDVSFSVGRGEIVALVGQNGSGKSTLVKILARYHEPDAGAIRLHGRDDGPVEGRDALESLHFIHQDLGLIPALSTVENLDIGRRLGGRRVLPPRSRDEIRHASALVARFGTDFDVRAPVARLTAAERTIVAIARALDGWTAPDNVLALDEPTAALHGEEVDKVFRAVRQVAAEGAGVIFVSHRLDEVFDLADRIVVLRDGRLVADAPRGAMTHDDLVRTMAGRHVAAIDHHGAGGHAPLLAVRDVVGHRVHGVGFDVCAGEIVGVCGILGSGREQLAGMLFGASPRLAGEVRVAGEEISPLDPGGAIAAGVAFVPADRVAQGEVASMNVRENLTLPLLRPLRRAGFRLSRQAERADAHRWLTEVDARPNDPERPIASLSGGNQQKVVLARWLRTRAKVLLLDEPTQGVDVAAKAAIYELIERAAAEGAGVLVSSSEAKELSLLCDRVLVMRAGRVAAEIPRSELSEARLVEEGLGVHGGARAGD
ncbi:MAG: sugar ABC transporter ATP-binding protein [Thermoleophilia bacterium]|nr:sugar ABC transporter ATP-binding protein [Thermoleophilia bacterium]